MVEYDYVTKKRDEVDAFPEKGMVDGAEKSCIARRVSDEEKAALWPHLCSLYPDFDEYQARTDRNIPVFECVAKQGYTKSEKTRPFPG